MVLLFFRPEIRSSKTDPVQFISAGHQRVPKSVNGEIVSCFRNRALVKTVFEAPKCL